MPSFSRRAFLKAGAVGLVGATAGCLGAQSAETGKLPTPFPRMYQLDDPINDWGNLTLRVDIPIEEFEASEATPPLGDEVPLYVAAYTYDGTMLAEHETAPLKAFEERTTPQGLLPEETTEELSTEIDLPLDNELSHGDAPITYALYVIPDTATPYEDATYVGETAPVQKRYNDISTVPLDTIRSETTLSNGEFRRDYNEGLYELNFSWNGGYTTIHVSALKHILSTQKPNRTPIAPYHDAVDNPLLRRLSEKLGAYAETEAEHAENVRSFAQTIPYFYDKTTSGHMEFPKYAEQTLVDGGGDCEDKTAVMMGIFAQEPFEYDQILVFPPNHVAGAVAKDDLPSTLVPENPVSFSLDGRDYLYVDSTNHRGFGRMERADKSEVRALYDGERWRQFNSAGIVQSAADGLKQWLTGNYE